MFEHINSWLMGKQVPRGRARTADSGLGTSIRTQPTPAKPRKHRSDKASLKNKRAVTKRASVIEASLVNNYLSDTKVTRPTKHELWAIVMPMAHGKTTLKRKYGFIDIDDLASDLVKGQAVDNLATEISLRSDWNAGMARFIDQAVANLAVLRFEGPVVILVHDWTTAERLGARVLGSFFLEDEPFSEALKGRTEFQRVLAQLNRALVKARDDEAYSCSSLSEVEELCLQMCFVNNIPTGAPCKFRDFETCPGYMTDNQDVLRGDDVDLDDLVEMFENFQVPRERVEYEVAKRKLGTYRGFGVTPGVWCETIGHADGDPKLRFDGILNRAQHRMENEDDIECKAIRKAQTSELSNILCAHWLTVGRFADDPESIFRLYLTPEDKFTVVMQNVARELSRSKFYMDLQLSKKDREIMMDMRWLSPRKQNLLQASGAIDVTPDKPMLGSACTLSQFNEILRCTELVSEPPIMVESAEALTAVLMNETRHYLRDYLLGMVDMGSDWESVMTRAPGETVQGSVLRLLLMLRVQNGGKVTDQTLESVGKLTGYDERYFSDVWYQMLEKANKLETDMTEKLIKVLVSILWQENSDDTVDWSLQYVKALEELVSNGKACVAMNEATGTRHNVVVGNEGIGYCTTTMESHQEWTTAMALSNVDVKKSRILRSTDVKMINAYRCMREMTRSKSLAISDLFGRDAHKHRRMVAMMGHAAEVLPDNEFTSLLLSGVCDHYGFKYGGERNKVHIWAKTIAFSSEDKNGLGGTMLGGMRYKTENKIVMRQNGEYATSAKFGKITKTKTKTVHFNTQLCIAKTITTEGVLAPSKTIASHGLSCAEVMELMCQHGSSRGELSALIKM